MGPYPPDHRSSQQRARLGRARWGFQAWWFSICSWPPSFKCADSDSVTVFQSGVIEQGASLLRLEDSKQFNQEIIIRAAHHSEENDRIAEAIKLYNLAGDYSTVVSCLAQALGNTISQSSPDEKARAIEKTAADILRHYERTNRAVGKNREAVIKLLRIREALDAKNSGKPDVALEVRPVFYWFGS